MLTRGDKRPDETQPLPVNGGSDPQQLPRVSVVEAIRRHKLLAVLPAVVLVLLALLYGLATTPTYTALSYQQIGRLDLNASGALSGFQSATETLATSYSRGIYATTVVDDVAERAGLTRSEARSRIAAYPVPESSVFVVAATGSSSDEAIDLSIQATRALRGYIEGLNRNNPAGDRLFREFRQAALEHSRLLGEAQRAARAAGGRPSAAERRAYRQLEARVAAAELERDVARANYAATQRSETTASLVQDLALADTASSDRFERLQMALFIALSVGVLLGIALAVLRANSDVRRALSVS